MINITLKAKHFYFITYYLKNFSLERYYSLFNRMKNALLNNNDLEQTFTISASVEEILNIYKTLTILPEGQSNTINVEMSALLEPQIQAGVAQEISDGIASDSDEAQWQPLGIAIQSIRQENISFRDAVINIGKSIIDL